MSIIDTLVTDRTQFDVDYVKSVETRIETGTATMEEIHEFIGASMKGAYNYTDLNRVDSALSYLSGVLNDAGYLVRLKDIEKTDTFTNLIANGNFSNGLTGWTVSGDMSLDGNAMLYQESAGVSMLSCTMPAPIPSHQYYGRLKIKSSEPVSAVDDRFEWYHSDTPGELMAFAHKSGNYPDWTMLSSILSVPADVSGDWMIRNFFVSLSGGNVLVTDQMILDLTATFGSGLEPDKSWCDANIPYIDGTKQITRTEWLVSDYPTTSQMQVYLNNIAAIRSAFTVLETTPQTPDSMKNLTYDKANDIEKILNDVNALILKVKAAYFYSGDLYAGEVNA